MRECGRADRGVARMVPKLREVHIIRDSWTKLNVTPAKIMQVGVSETYGDHRNYYCYPNFSKKMF